MGGTGWASNTRSSKSSFLSLISFCKYPVLISGPLTSIIIAGSRLSLFPTVLILEDISRTHSWLAWAMFILQTSTPLVINRSRFCSLSVAGPIVAITFVCLLSFFISELSGLCMDQPQMWKTLCHGLLDWKICLVLF